MSDPQSSTNRPAPESSSQPSPKPRNPVERVVVWGVIIVGLALITVQARAWYNCRQSLQRILEAVQTTEASTDISHVTIDSITPLLVGHPVSSDETMGIDGVRHYVWKGLLKDYGIHLRYGVKSRMITEVLNDNPPPPPPPRPVMETADEVPVEGEHGGPMPGGPGGGPPGGGGGRGGFNPMQFDADGDGRLSREEAPERMLASFAEIDANGDGFLDAEELAARRAQRGPRSGPPGSHDESGSRPQRPPTEEASPPPDGSTGTPPPADSPAPNAPSETRPSTDAAPPTPEGTEAN
jgi:hypothetical protein